MGTLVSRVAHVSPHAMPGEGIDGHRMRLKQCIGPTDADVRKLGTRMQRIAHDGPSVVNVEHASLRISRNDLEVAVCAGLASCGRELPMVGVNSGSLSRLRM